MYYLSMKEGSLFVLFVLMRSTEPDPLDRVLGLFGSSWGGGVHQLGFVAFGLVVQKFLNIEWFLHYKSN
jgi:hypothetical protein